MSDWIRVEDGLPNPHQSVLAFRPENNAGEDQIWYAYHSGGKWIDDANDYDDLENLPFGGESSRLKVTHWMPLPEPPKD